MNYSKTSPAAVIAGGLVLAALLGCGREPSVAEKSAAAFREAQKRGEPLGGDGHAHGHGAITPGGGQTASAEDPHAGHGGEPAAGHDHGTAKASGAGDEHARHGTTGTARSADHGDHAAMGHDRRAEPGGAPHTGHGTTSPRASTSGAQPPHTGHEGHTAASPQPPASSGAQPPGAGHAGHAPAAGAMPPVPSAPAPAAVSPEQAAKTLRSDALDAPAATSVLDAQRSAEIARDMSGGHGGHGAGTYRQIDAGRGPGAYEGSEPQTPGAGPQHHDHGSEPSHKPPGGASAVFYVCPMHPEVTRQTPGTCPICGMTLVERRKE